LFLKSEGPNPLNGLVQFALPLVELFNRTVRDVEGIGIRKMTTSTDDDGIQSTRLYYVISGAQFKVGKKRILRF
jgi:hypothetical protein